MSSVFKCMTGEEASRFMARSRHRLARAAAKKADGKKVTDLGCGSGALVKDLYKPSLYIGIDCSLELIKLAKRNNPAHTFFCADILDFTAQMRDNSCEVVVMTEVLEHVGSLETAQSIYNEVSRISNHAYIGWHTPPHYKKTKIRKVQAELEHLVNHNLYAEGSFASPKRIEKIGSGELWTLSV